MRFTPEQLCAAVARVRARRNRNARALDRKVEDVRCEICLIADPRHERHVAQQLVLAERAGIRSVWTHGLWSFEDGQWVARL